MTYYVSASGLLVAILGIVVLGLAYLTWKARRKFYDDSRVNAYAYAFVFVTSALAWGLAVWLGARTLAIMKPYNDISNMNVYIDVDPAKRTASQVMDAGRIMFTPGSKLDVGLSSSFKASRVYCVAPVTPGRTSDISDVISYDFWAVGIGCCSGDRPDFHCGEVDNPKAAAGLRVLDSASQPYFRLAVQQAEAAHKISAPHPVFLHWMQDPSTDLVTYPEHAHQRHLMGCLFFALFQLFAVVTFVLFAQKLSEGH